MNEIRDFLRKRRAAVDPADTDLPVAQLRRRTSGLRREEVALLANISADYYSRLEQGRVRSASPTVISAVARALRLSHDETVYLQDLLSGTTGGESAPASGPAIALVRAIESITNGPAYILGRRTEVLAWNPLARALLGGATDSETNSTTLARFVFLDPRAKDVFVDWDDAAGSTAAHLRFVSSKHRNDRELAALVGELTMKSVEFATRWAKHTVGMRSGGRKTLRHNMVGEVDLDYHVLRLSEEHSLFVFSPAPGSTAEESLALLASWHLASEIASDR
ncbi:helix-turn-helix transcriptional regulator [Rhodococcus sp. G-MC3]|uniref:helix-turn-helix transcriptional regulator n=1 Tax=Rhodococcus sp. G-MC3 TaxID=3046209 RepID=UPI0024BBB4BB|nr:helix-turn-helix transcriptional regulator [Rhodococcus sp. G-MC3]MDJ0396708.1 helix-turn-helix transcriptional regulator [Rhodococcus sp. G-MC3]